MFDYVRLGSRDIPDRSRGMGIRVVAGKGSGKSRLIGRTVVFQDFVRRVPTLVIDPTQSLINNALDKVLRLPPHVQQAAYKRIRYINLAGEADSNGAMRVVPFPLLYKARSPFDAAQRFPDVMERIDPALRSAPMLGIEALRNIATDAGSVLYALGWQYSEAEAIIKHAPEYRAQIMQALEQEPSIRPSAEYLLDEFPKLRPQEQEMKTSSFFARTNRFSRDQISRAVYCASTPAFSWDELLEDNLLVLIDVSKVPTAQRKFAMQWIYQSFIDWVRIESGLERAQPISLVIDELTEMLGNPADNSDPMAEALRQLVDVIARNHKIWVTVLHQEENQVSQQVQMRLNGLGNQIIGVTSDPDAARKVASRFIRYDPHQQKRADAVYASEQVRDAYGDVVGTDHLILDYRPVEYSIQEQQEINSRAFLELPAFTFKIGISKREGSLPSTLTELSTAMIDAGEFPQTELLPVVRATLMERDGIPVQEVLKEISRRIQHTDTPPQQDASLPVSARRVARRSL